MTSLPGAAGACGSAGGGTARAEGATRWPLSGDAGAEAGAGVGVVIGSGAAGAGAGTTEVDAGGDAGTTTSVSSRVWSVLRATCVDCAGAPSLTRNEETVRYPMAQS